MAHVRQRHPSTLNLGMTSNGPLLTLATIQEYVPRLLPKNVLWVYYEENDIGTDLPVERRMAFLHRYLDGEFSQGLFDRQDEIDDRLRSWISTGKGKMPRHVNLPPDAGHLAGINIVNLVFLRNLRNGLNLGLGPGNDDIDLFAATLRAARDMVEKNGGRLFFVYLPGLRRYANVTGRLFQDLTRDRVLHVVRHDLGIPVIDIAAVFDGQADPRALFYRHYTDEGNALVGKAILDTLDGAS